MNTALKQYLESAKVIEVVSGKGELGVTELFTGRRTKLALIRRVKKERCGGDRWCYIKVDGVRLYLTEQGMMQ